MSKQFLSKFNTVWNNKCSSYKKLPSVLPETRRIIVIGDIHGDFNVLKKCLDMAGLINRKDQWIGGDTVVVQVGDQIDSCRFDGINTCNQPNVTDNDKAEDVKILRYLTALHTKADKAGGAVYSLIGNHELLNVDGDMTYVSYNNIQDFEEYEDSEGEIIEDPLTARKYAFKPGNEIANFLACTRQMALIIGSNLFVHAGIVPEIANKYSVTDLNKILSLYLLDQLENPRDFSDIFLSVARSPLWNRVFGDINKSSKKCRELMEPLEQVYRVGKVFVGHTPMMTKGITSTCDDQIYLVDVGMGKGFDKFDTSYLSSGKKSKTREATVLEIKNDTEITVIV